MAAEEKEGPPSPRTLDRDVPELRDYLRPGMKVLDVGCGPGTITVGVAKAVEPGQVIGIDPSEREISTARDWAARAPVDGSLSFSVGDAHELDFPDATFDVVYSHTVTHFLLDPVRALREQKRVAKPGGWVVASGVRDPGILNRYPACPNWDAAWRALSRYYDSMQEGMRAKGEAPTAYHDRETEQLPSYLFFWDMHAARKCPGWFREAGLSNLEVRIKGDMVKFHGSESMEPSTADLLPTDVPQPEGEHQRRVNLEYRRLVEAGLLDRETLDRARDEARNWYRDARAFHYWVLVFVAGQA